MPDSVPRQPGPAAESADEIIVANTPQHFDIVRSLFVEYADSLQIDLCFQNFKEELATLPGDYAAPTGRLFLAGLPKGAGCVAVRPIDALTCEMKRLYVRPDFRCSGLGRRLALRAVEAGRELGYRRMRLDTLSSLTAAISLYQSLGFIQIAPYYHNPSACAVFMEKELR